MINRRQFLAAGAASIVASRFLPTAALAADTGGYKALVCCFLAGGLDAHDTLIPLDNASYNFWRSGRQSILNEFERLGTAQRREQSGLLALNNPAGFDPGGNFGMPAELRPLYELYNEGKMAVVANVGPLIEPTDRESAENGTARLPARLQSHNDQQSTWQSLTPEGASLGWGGQFADAVNEGSDYQAVSLAGNTAFLVGRDVRPVSMGKRGVVTSIFSGTNKLYGSSELRGVFSEHLKIAGAGSNNIFERDISRVQSDAVDITNKLSAVFNSESIGEQVTVSENGLSTQLALVAEMIAARSQLGASRQVFFVKMGGFDTHANHAEDIPVLHAKMAAAIASFNAGMEAIGLSESVTLFTASDFGRTLNANSTGTDHGWGCHHFVVGGAVKGGRITGQMPEFTDGHAQDFGRGIMIPTTSIEQYAAPLGRWFGLSESELAGVFPELSRFNAPEPVLF